MNFCHVGLVRRSSRVVEALDDWLRHLFYDKLHIMYRNLYMNIYMSVSVHYYVLLRFPILCSVTHYFGQRMPV